MAPPVYGSWQAAQATVPADAEPPAWLRELNLDPSARAVAGLGVVVVQEAQEQLVAGGLGAARRPGRGARRSSGASRSRSPSSARSCVAASSRWRPAGSCSSSARARAAAHVAGDAARAPRTQDLPPSFSSASFRRLATRGERRPGAAPRHDDADPASGDPPREPVPGRRPCAAAPGLVTRRELVQQVNKMPRTAISAAPPLPDAAASAVRDYVNDFFGVRSMPGPRRTFSFDAQLQDDAGREARPAADGAAALLRASRPGRGTSVAAAAPLPGDTVLFTPSFPQPMYEPLRDLSPELLLPGVGTIEPTPSRS